MITFLKFIIFIINKLKYYVNRGYCLSVSKNIKGI